MWLRNDFRLCTVIKTSLQRPPLLKKSGRDQLPTVPFILILPFTNSVKRPPLRNGTRYIRSFFSCCHTNRRSISYVTCLIRHLTSTTTQAIGWWVQTTSAGSQYATWLMTSILSRGKWGLVPTRICNLWLIPLWNTRARLIDTGVWWFSVTKREGRVIDSCWLNTERSYKRQGHTPSKHFVGFPAQWWKGRITVA